MMDFLWQIFLAVWTCIGIGIGLFVLIILMLVVLAGLATMLDSRGKEDGRVE